MKKLFTIIELDLYDFQSISYFSGSAGVPNVGHGIITLNAGDVISLVNVYGTTGSSVNLINHPTAINASMVIKRLS